MKLPDSVNLPVHHLAGIFKTTTNSYKFYWFLALLDQASSGKKIVQIDEMIIQMIGMVWYPITNFRLSFGKQDQFDKSIQTIQYVMGCDKSLSNNKLIYELHRNKDLDDIQDLVRKLSKFVPQRLLRPWFAKELRNYKDHQKDDVTIELADKYFENAANCPLYRINREKDLIEISSEWLDYLKTHVHILQSFAYWHLIQYLYKHNPNVPNIATKLFPPDSRSLDRGKKFWRIYEEYNGGVRCVYTGKNLKGTEVEIDHFLPWEYVGHDQLWNLTPTYRSFNSSKGDRLPSDQSLYDNFASLQYEAFSIVYKKLTKKQLSLLEDYSLLFNRESDQIFDMTKKDFTDKLKETLYPQYQIALNMGFPIMDSSNNND